ncbi:uncharacterized protein [Dermacentor albipictus]|uniref:uncharacterized protein isoform X2 n=1 Tax=Dermacentor albipictus TaxID=60249 RepID=UPI0038FC2A48
MRYAWARSLLRQLANGLRRRPAVLRVWVFGKNSVVFVRIHCGSTQSVELFLVGRQECVPNLSGPLCEVFQTWRPPVASALCATRMTIHRGFCSRKESICFSSSSLKSSEEQCFAVQHCFSHWRCKAWLFDTIMSVT